MIAVIFIPQVSLAAGLMDFLKGLIPSAPTDVQVGPDGFSISTSGNSGYYGSGIGNGSGGWSVGNVAGYGLPQGSVAGIISGILSWLLAIFGFIGIIGFVIAGIMYILSAGNDTMLEKAKAAMTWSIVGIVVGLIGFIVVQAIDRMLNINPSF